MFIGEAVHNVMHGILTNTFFWGGGGAEYSFTCMEILLSCMKMKISCMNVSYHDFVMHETFRAGGIKVMIAMTLITT